MSSVQVAPTVAPVPPAWTTPQILKTGMAGVWLTSALLMLAAISGAQSHRHAMRVVGKDSAPSIVAAQHIRSALADMDAQAAKEMLGDKNAQAAFEARRNEAIAYVIAAAENITYGHDERIPIRTLALGIGSYTAARQTALDKSSLPAWSGAVSIMDGTLLPAADALDHANRSALDETYEGQRKASIRASVLLILAAVAVGFTLVAMQIFIAGRMRRILNPGLFLATLAAFIFVVYTGQRFQASDRDLKVAKEDAFESIHTLLQAGAVASAANADVGRYLADPAHRQDYEKQFGIKAERITNEFLPNELKNITFPGEREAATETVEGFNEYMGVEKLVRTFAESGHHDSAVALYTGDGPKQSDQVFSRFENALARTIEVNQTAFEAAVARGFQDVAGFEISAPVVAFLISVLAWLGLRARIREYSA